VQYLILAENHTASVLDTFGLRSHQQKSVGECLRELIIDGIVTTALKYPNIAIRNLSDAEQWLIDTMPRTPAEE
jgi:hypothetical protein